MNKSPLEIGSNVSISRDELSKILTLPPGAPGEEIQGQVIADVKNAFNPNLKLVMFAREATWGHQFDNLSEGYRNLITKANTISPIHEYWKRRYCGLNSDLLKNNLNRRVTTSVREMRRDIIPSEFLCDNAHPSKILHGTVVADWSVHSSVVMFDALDKYGYLLKDMAPSVRDKIEKLNIPNVHKRRFICTYNNNLTFSNSSSVTQTRNNTMSNKMVETLKGDAKEAAYRVAGTQITNGVKTGLLKLVESKGGKSEQVEMFKGLLDSEVGESVIALILGYGLNYAPGIKDDPRVQKLSEEFRINGMAVAGNAIVGAAMESFLPVLTGALNALPAEETSKPRLVQTSEEEEDEEAVVPPARASKRAGG